MWNRKERRDPKKIFDDKIFILPMIKKLKELEIYKTKKCFYINKTNNLAYNKSNENASHLMVLELSRLDIMS